MTVPTVASAVRLLSHNQRALWLSAQIAPESAASNVYASVRIPATLDLAAWQSAWQQVVARHETLRSTCTTDATGTPVTLVQADALPDLAIADVTEYSETRLQAQILAESDRPFDLEYDLPLRVRLYRKSRDDYYQLVVLHEIAGELRSIEILLREFRRAYAKALKSPFEKSADRPACVPSKHLTERDFAFETAPPTPIA